MVMGVFWGIEVIWENFLGKYVADTGMRIVILLGYIVIFAGIAIEIIVGNVFYKRKLSDYAFKGVLNVSK